MDWKEYRKASLLALVLLLAVTSIFIIQRIQHGQRVKTALARMQLMREQDALFASSRLPRVWYGIFEKSDENIPYDPFVVSAKMTTGSQEVQFRTKDALANMHDRAKTICQELKLRIEIDRPEVITCIESGNGVMQITFATEGDYRLVTVRRFAE